MNLSEIIVLAIQLSVTLKELHFLEVNTLFITIIPHKVAREIRRGISYKWNEKISVVQRKGYNLKCPFSKGLANTFSAFIYFVIKQKEIKFVLF